MEVVYIVKWFHLTPKGHICSIHILRPKIEFSIHFSPKSLRYRLRWNPYKSSKIPHSNSSKTTQFNTQITLKPNKSSTPSKSTKIQHLYRNKYQFQHQSKQSIYYPKPTKSSILANILSNKPPLSPKPSIPNQNKKYQIYILTT